jgi:hypothetical protein
MKRTLRRILEEEAAEFQRTMKEDSREQIAQFGASVQRSYIETAPYVVVVGAP